MHDGCYQLCGILWLPLRDLIIKFNCIYWIIMQDIMQSTTLFSNIIIVGKIHSINFEHCHIVIKSIVMWNSRPPLYTFPPKIFLNLADVYKPASIVHTRYIQSTTINCLPRACSMANIIYVCSASAHRIQFVFLTYYWILRALWYKSKSKVTNALLFGSTRSCRNVWG